INLQNKAIAYENRIKQLEKELAAKNAEPPAQSPAAHKPEAPISSVLGSNDDQLKKDLAKARDSEQQLKIDLLDARNKLKQTEMKAKDLEDKLKAMAES